MKQEEEEEGGLVFSERLFRMSAGSAADHGR
jgi:hypothetical protein